MEATSFRSGLDADKPAAPAAGDIWLARDTYKLYMCFVAGAWVDLGSRITQSAPGKAKDTVYQNTTGKLLAVVIGVGLGAAVSQCTVYCDAANPPVTQVGYGYNPGMAGGMGVTISFVVPPNYYYKLTTSAGTLVVSSWIEYTLH